MRRLVPVDEIAELLSLPIATIYDLARRNDLPSVRIARKILRFDLDEIERVIDSRRNRPARVSRPRKATAA
jgi:excisionase family DNA binding protein